MFAAQLRMKQISLEDSSLDFLHNQAALHPQKASLTKKGPTVSGSRGPALPRYSIERMTAIPRSERALAVKCKSPWPARRC